jgi:hypothetical protein
MWDERSLPLVNRWIAVGHPLPPTVSYSEPYSGRPLEHDDTDLRYRQTVTEERGPNSDIPRTVAVPTQSSLSPSSSLLSNSPRGLGQPSPAASRHLEDDKAIYITPPSPELPIQTTFSDLLSRLDDYPHDGFT